MVKSKARLLVEIKSAGYKPIAAAPIENRIIMLVATNRARSRWRHDRTTINMPATPAANGSTYAQGCSM